MRVKHRIIRLVTNLQVVWLGMLALAFVGRIVRPDGVIWGS